MIPLKLVAANDTFGALLALGEALAGKQAVFITSPETNGLMPEVHGLPAEVPDGVALIVESSGSTGTPKRITLPRAALLASAQGSDVALGGTGQWLLALPINYIAGANVLIRSLVAETQPVLMNTTLPFTPQAFALAASQMTGSRRYTALVPTQLWRLLRDSYHDAFLLEKLRRFDAILVGGAAIDSALLASAAEQGIVVVTSYGSAETAGGVVYDGVPFAGTKLSLDLKGRILISGPTLAQDLPLTKLMGTEWFRTSDLGRFDEGERLHVIGRVNRVLNSGGVKVSLDSIEELVRAIGGVVQAAALAVTDAEWGERAALVYVGSPEIADYIAAECLSQLGPAAKPVRVLRVATIPRLANGKTDYLGLATAISAGS